MTDEWGPWIEHDGKGCPVPNGTIVQVVYDLEIELTAVVSANGRKDIHNPWIWDKRFLGNIIRYRIRKPKGLTILEALLENLPQKEDVKEREGVE